MMRRNLEEELLISKCYQESKNSYDSITIPEQLDCKVRGVFDEYEKNNRENKVLRRTVIAVAACFSVFVIGLNTSESFAVSAEKIPFIGSVAKVFTLRSYKDTNENRTLEAEVPQIEVETDSEEVQQKVVDINAEIDSLVQQCVEVANQHIAEYKEAFIATGGTEDEFTDKNIHANVTYEVKAQSDEMISIVITSTEDWASAYTEQYFYTLELSTGNVLTLKDILGDEYITIANDSIRDTMEQRVAEDKDLYYFSEAEGGFTTIDRDTKFYVNEIGNPVVVFAKYEVAPGFMGIQEFEIER